MEKSKDDAINLERSKAFEEHQKLTDKVNSLKRDMEKQTNEELGEGAEIDLFEALKEEFPDDNIKPIAKGSPGADIRHIVMLHGKECGTIIYDSKNHKLHIHDGIVLANPARVVSITIMIRQHLLQAHTLRLSSIERENKTAALYEFITSEQCTELLSRVDERAGELLEQQVKEKKWHENHWQKQGEAFRAIQKANAALENQIGNIIGTSTDESLAGESSQP